MKKSVLLFLLGGSAIMSAQTPPPEKHLPDPNPNNKVGINVEVPTKDLDVNGGARVRDMELANTPAKLANYPYYVVSTGDGILGRTTIASSKLLVNIDKTPTGLYWNSRNASNQSLESSYQGIQDNFPYYQIFGDNGTRNIDQQLQAEAKGGYTAENKFNVISHDILNISCNLTFKIAKNYDNNNGDLDTPNPEIPETHFKGNRQVIFYLTLYRVDGGTHTIEKQIKQVVNFIGGKVSNNLKRSSFDNKFHQRLEMNYAVPENKGGEYKIGVVVATKAPENGQFRINFAPYNQNLLVYKL
ncbi:MAG: hypothetical protein Q4A00_04730 [Flavobacteriaceae bacterium]|nr:hypothetical protein [Flavobacteriaceae bacterium]